MNREKIGRYYGELYNYRTGELIRPATRAEQTASEKAAERDGGVGVITVGRVSCYVENGTRAPKPTERGLAVPDLLAGVRLAAELGVTLDVLAGTAPLPRL